MTNPPSEALTFLKRAADGEHRIVSSGDLTTFQIAEAQSQGRFYVEPGGGLGWALLPWHLTTDKDQQRAGLAMARERYVLGEGYGLGKGVLNDGPHKGAFAWIGLTDKPSGAVALPLTFPDTSRVIGGVVQQPKSRRKFRLVLEVIAEAEKPFDHHTTEQA